VAARRDRPDWRPADRFAKALLDVAEKNVDVILPGFTHLQVAQPVSFGHHMLAYVEMFSTRRRAHDRSAPRTNRLPLGAAALAGTSYPLDRERVAKAWAWWTLLATPRSARTAWTP
jgi:argininosuccinate lyase